MSLRFGPGDQEPSDAPAAAGNGHSAHSREELESRANLVLSEILRRLDVLDARRHQVQHAGGLVKYEVKRHLPLTLAAGAGAVAIGYVVVRLVRNRNEREFRRQVFRRVLARVMGEEVVEPPRRVSVLGAGLRTAGLRLLWLAGSELGRRALTRALEPPRY